MITASIIHKIVFASKLTTLSLLVGCVVGYNQH